MFTSRMARWVSACILCVPVSAWAQNQVVTFTNGVKLGADQLNTMQQGLVARSGGSSENQSLTNPTATGGSWQGLLTLGMAGAQTMTVNPTGIGSRTVKSSLYASDAVNDGTMSVWPHVIQTTSATGYGAIDPIWGGEADRVNLFAGMSCLAGSSACWALNPLVYLGPGFQDSAHGAEIDVENYSSDRDPAVNGYKPINGLEITGGGSYLASYAMDVVGNTSTIPHLFHDAFAVLGGAAQDNSFIDVGDATESLHILGSHGIGLDLAYASISNSAILLSTSQAIDFLNTSNGTKIHAISSDGQNVVAGAPIAAPSGINPSTHGYVWAQPFIAGLQGYAANSAGGTAWFTQSHGNWNIFKSLQQYNPTELQVYTSAFQGTATLSGNTLTLVSGDAFEQVMVGRQGFFFGGAQYLVSAWIDYNHVTVTKTDGSAVNVTTPMQDTYYYTTTTVDNVCNVANGTVTYVSGQPFIGGINYFTINGTDYTSSITGEAPGALTLSNTTLAATSAACHTDSASPNNEISTMRLQGLWGGNEENFSFTVRPDGDYIQSQYAGTGHYRPIYLTTGENPAGTLNPMISLLPNSTIGGPGTILLGGNWTTAIVRMQQGGNNVNRIGISGGATGVGPTIQAEGADNNVPLTLSPKGSAPIYFGGVTQLHYYTVATLPACTSSILGGLAMVGDATSPTWNAAPVGGGTMSVPVFCGATGWTVH